MARMPYPLNCLYNHGRVGMAGMPYPPTESLYNPNFNPIEFEGFRKEAGLNAFTMSPTK